MTAKVLQLCGQVFPGPSPGKGNTAALGVVIRPEARVFLHHLRAGKGVLPFSFATRVVLRGEMGWLASCQLLQSRNSLVLFIAGIKQGACI